jgi:hypothetical protein
VTGTPLLVALQLCAAELVNEGCHKKVEWIKDAALLG